MTSPIPTAQRIADESAALQLLRHCGSCPHAHSEYIPFNKQWLQQSQAAAAVQITAATILHQAHDIGEAQSVADWLKQVAHEIESLVLREQIMRTRTLADEQSRQLALRKRQSRIEVDANTMAAIDALESLIDGRGTEGVIK